MLCDQQVATSFSVRDILDFNENNNLISSGSEVDSSIIHANHAMLEPMMAVNPVESAEVNANYYTNYWLENNHNHDGRLTMEEHQAPPSYQSLQQQQLHHHSTVVEPPHYEYPAYNYMGYSCLPDDCNRFPEDEEVKMIANRSINRPLTTSHHVQQLSHLCQPFAEQDNVCSNNVSDVNSAKSKLNSRKFQCNYLTTFYGE